MNGDAEVLDETLLGGGGHYHSVMGIGPQIPSRPLGIRFTKNLAQAQRTPASNANSLQLRNLSSVIDTAPIKVLRGLTSVLRWRFALAGPRPFTFTGVARFLHIDSGIY
jgi:hypothetical protein